MSLYNNAYTSEWPIIPTLHFSEAIASSSRNVYTSYHMYVYTVLRSPSIACVNHTSCSSDLLQVGCSVKQGHPCEGSPARVCVHVLQTHEIHASLYYKLRMGVKLCTTNTYVCLKPWYFSTSMWHVCSNDPCNSLVQLQEKKPYIICTNCGYLMMMFLKTPVDLSQREREQLKHGDV